jgi:hypothetical protein
MASKRKVSETEASAKKATSEISKQEAASNVATVKKETTKEPPEAKTVNVTIKSLSGSIDHVLTVASGATIAQVRIAMQKAYRLWQC